MSSSREKTESKQFLCNLTSCLMSSTTSLDTSLARSMPVTLTRGEMVMKSEGWGERSDSLTGGDSRSMKASWRKRRWWYVANLGSQLQGREAVWPCHCDTVIPLCKENHPGIWVKVGEASPPWAKGKPTGAAHQARQAVLLWQGLTISCVVNWTLRTDH